MILPTSWYKKALIVEIEDGSHRKMTNKTKPSVVEEVCSHENKKQKRAVLK